MPVLSGHAYTFREQEDVDHDALLALVALVEHTALVLGCRFSVAIHDESGQIAGYVAFRPDSVEGWDIEVVAVATHPGHRQRGLYKALNVWIVRDAQPELRVCAYVNDPITEHVVTTQWNPDVWRLCEDGSRFYGTTVGQVER